MVNCENEGCNRYIPSKNKKDFLCGKCSYKWFKTEVCYTCKGFKPGYLFCDTCKSIIVVHT
jgi:hypothetical protein